MRRVRVTYVIIGLVVTAVTAICLNLISAAIQQRTLHDQFDNRAIVLLIAVVVAGFAITLWLKKRSPSVEMEQESEDPDSHRSKFHVTANNIGVVGDRNEVYMQIDTESQESCR